MGVVRRAEASAWWGWEKDGGVARWQTNRQIDKQTNKQPVFNFGVEFLDIEDRCEGRGGKRMGVAAGWR